MTPSEDTRLVKTVREKLDSGYSIAIVGWKSSNHDDFTRSLPETFVFFDDAPLVMPKRVGYAVISRFVGHDETRRVRRQVHNHPNLFSIGHIRRLLKEAAKGDSPSAVPQQPPLQETGIMTQASAEVPATSPAGTSNSAELGEKEKELAFAHAFCKAVDHNPDGELSKYEVHQVLRAHFGEKANASHFKTLLEPVVKEGNTKAGSYKATKYLLELATSYDEEPSDPIERARWLIAQEPKLEQRHNALAAEMKAINVKMDRIKRAKELLESLKRL